MKNLKTTIYLLTSLLMGLTGVSQNEGVSIKTSGGAPDQSAMLDVVHPSKGLLIPRVNLVTTTNSTSPVSNPADGLLVFNLTSTVSTGRGFHYWDQPTSSWTKLTTGSNLWSLIGATSHIHYTNGNVRVGTASTVSPTYVFEVINSSGTNTYTTLFEGRQGQLKFAFLDPVSQPSVGYGSYLTQTSKLAGDGKYYSMRFSQVHGDGWKGLSLTTFLRPPGFTTPWTVIESNDNNLFITSGRDLVLTRGGGTASSAAVILNSNGQWVPYSDSTLKRDITTMSTVLAKVLACRPVTFRWKSAGATGPLVDGLIAQEVAVQFPRLVESMTVLSNTNDPDSGVTKQTLNSDGLIPILIKAIQEQQVIIDDLKTRLHALDGK